jgi:Fe-S oxidoreductase
MPIIIFFPFLYDDLTRRFFFSTSCHQITSQSTVLTGICHVDDAYDEHRTQTSSIPRFCEQSFLEAKILGSKYSWYFLPGTRNPIFLCHIPVRLADHKECEAESFSLCNRCLRESRSCDVGDNTGNIITAHDREREERERVIESRVFFRV